jgi:uncharacterized protein (DUF1330 family)
MPDAAVYALVDLHITDAAFTPEGTAPRSGRRIVFESPSEGQVRAWRADPEHQALSEHRPAGTRLGLLTVVHGLPPR